MNAESIILLVLFAAGIIALVLDHLSVDVFALGTVIILVISGTLTPAEAFSGFSNEVIFILCAVFILSGAIVRTGVMEWLGHWVYRLSGKTEGKAIAYLMGFSAGISGLISNTTTTGMLMPSVLEYSRKSNLSPSRFLIPLAYATMLGGSCTLIGTSANLASSGFIQKSGLKPFGLFEFLPVGVAVSVVGILYMVLIGRHLLPNAAKASLTEEFEVDHFVSEIIVGENCEYSGKSLEQLELTDKGVRVLAILRGGERKIPMPGTILEAGDELIVQSSQQNLLALESTPGLTFEAAHDVDDADLLGNGSKLAEAVIMPRSLLLGRTLRGIDFRRRFRVSVLAIYRKGVSYSNGIRNLPLETGDVLLLRGDPEKLHALQMDRTIWIIGDVAHIPFKTRKGLTVVGALIGAAALGATGVLPLSISFLLAVLFVIFAKCISVEEIYDFIDWRVIVLIGGMTSVGMALQKSSLADQIARFVADITLPIGEYAVLAAFILLTMVLTQLLSNAAAALVVLPIAMSTGTQVGIDPRTLAVIVTLAASLSFIAPFEPACLLVYSPGRYRFRDFVISGIPLSVAAFILLMVLVPVFWPLH